MPQHTAFEVIVTSNQSGATLGNRGNLQGRVSGVKLGTLSPGGCGDASMKFYAPWRTIPVQLGINFRVQFRYARRVVWSGRVEDFDTSRDSNGEYWQVGIKGDGINLDDQGPTISAPYNAQNKATDQIVADAVSSYTQQIDSTAITATGVTISNATAVDLKRMTAAAVLNWAAGLGNSSYQQMLWYVHPTVDGARVLTFKPRPTAPDLLAYTSDFDGLKWGFKFRNMANRITVTYNNGANDVTVDDTTLQGPGPAGWGVIRNLTFDFPEVTQASDATQIANVLLATAKVAKMSAQNLVLKAGAVIRRGSGSAEPGPVDPWMVRAGQVLQLADVDPGIGSPSGSITYRNSCLIAQTTWDEDSQTLTLVPENMDNALSNVVARVRGLLAGKHTV